MFCVLFVFRVLSVMISCLDTYLLLQSQYKFQDVLLSSQAENHPNNKYDIVVLIVIARRYILKFCPVCETCFEKKHPVLYPFLNHFKMSQLSNQISPEGSTV